VNRVARDGDAGIDIAALRAQRFDIGAVHGRLAALGLAGLLSTACSGPLSILDPATAPTERIADLWWVMLAASIVILAGVMVLFLWPFLRGGSRRPVSTRTYLLGGGLVFPIVTLTALLVYALGFGQWLLPRPDEEVVRVEAQGQQWWWEFTHYDEAGEAVRVANELHLPAGRPIEVTVVSADVIHSFWVPRLAGKLDAVPGHVNVLRIDPAEPGTYAGVCAEFCGLEHAGMRFTTIVHPAEDYARALAEAAAAEQ